MNGFLEPESTNSDPNHAFLCSIKAEIFTFLPEKAAILVGFFCFYGRPINFNVAPLPDLIVRPKKPLIPKMVLLSAL